jgi:hypothetical protein
LIWRVGPNEFLTPINIEPFRGLNDSRLWISSDGNLVALSDIMKHQSAGFVVADLRSGDVALQRAERLVTFPRASFLPDGKRMMVEWAPHFETIQINGMPHAPANQSKPERFCCTKSRRKRN